MEILGTLIKNIETSAEDAVVVTDELRYMIQQRLLRMFDDIRQVCEEYGIHYQLCGGSALGAVRHQGFIPWDDDIDLAMERKEFEKFLPLFEARFSARYLVHIPGRNPACNYLFAQVMDREIHARELMEKKNDHLGLCIDIFQIDNVPNCRFLRNLHGFLCMANRYVISCIRFHENREELSRFIGESQQLKRMFWMRSSLGGVFNLIPKQAWMKQGLRLLSLCHNDNSEYVTIPTGIKQYFTEMYPRDPFCKTQTMLFEHRQVEVSQYYDQYLHILYGDYMQIPPEGNRGKHVFLELDVEALKRWFKETESLHHA